MTWSVEITIFQHTPCNLLANTSAQGTRNGVNASLSEPHEVPLVASRQSSKVHTPTVAHLADNDQRVTRPPTVDMNLSTILSDMNLSTILSDSQGLEPALVPPHRPNRIEPTANTTANTTDLVSTQHTCLYSTYSRFTIFQQPTGDCCWGSGKSQLVRKLRVNFTFCQTKARHILFTWNN